ncbi:MAG: hypothetical protein KDA28_07400 [Phycisphaerales bacterium]|nr:hypothetical protein [Phycisphaerales bacterium]
MAPESHGSVRAQCLAVLGAVAVAAADDFASTVIDYRPAPGYFANQCEFLKPEAALGPPDGGGTIAPSFDDIVYLGGFGGSITLGFADTVLDAPLNPFGLDAIVFGNAFWIENLPDSRFGEAGVIEISRDLNGNGLADDPWYVIPGSAIPNALQAYRVQCWDDDFFDDTCPPLGFVSGYWFNCSCEAHPQCTGVYSTAAYETTLTPPLFCEGAPYECVVGYADCTPVMVRGDLDGDNTMDVDLDASIFYTRPDDPFLQGITPGSGGGDAFDIAWAVNPATGLPANLGGFDFIRISTSVDVLRPGLGEVSTEVSAVADVRPGFPALRGSGYAYGDEFESRDPVPLTLDMLLDHLEEMIDE